jgi:hypothetical protein
MYCCCVFHRVQNRRVWKFHDICRQCSNFPFAHISIALCLFHFSFYHSFSLPDSHALLLVPEFRDACTHTSFAHRQWIHSIPSPSPAPALFRQVVACTGLALCALHSLSLDKAAEHCASGLRAVRMTMATSQARMLYQSMIASDNREKKFHNMVRTCQINSHEQIRLVLMNRFS